MRTAFAVSAILLPLVLMPAAAQERDVPSTFSYIQPSIGVAFDTGFAASLAYGRPVAGVTVEGELIAVTGGLCPGECGTTEEGATGLVNVVFGSRQGAVRPYVAVGAGYGSLGESGVGYQAKAGLAVRTFQRQAVTLDARVIGIGGEDSYSSGAAMIGYRFGFGA